MHGVQQDSIRTADNKIFISSHHLKGLIPLSLSPEQNSPKLMQHLFGETLTNVAIFWGKLTKHNLNIFWTQEHFSSIYRK